MKYESAKTEKGNVGVSYESQEAADLQAAAMDKNGCSGCSDCTGCTDCSGCSGCRYCRYCHGCSGCRYCHGCTGCTDCHGCSGCRYCHGCTDCTDCSGCTDTQGTLRWKGGPAKALLSLNGLRWPVSTDGKSIQIGCQHHSVELWANFGDGEISCMDSGALEFWTQHKKTVLGLAEVRRLMEETQ